jgi:hypothetical protein
MLIITYTTKSLLAWVEIVPTLTCPRCKKPGQVEISVFRKVFAIFTAFGASGINVFPVGSYGAACCRQCERPISVAAARAELTAAFKGLSAKAGFRLRDYAFIFLLMPICGFIGAAYGTSVYGRDQNTAFDQSKLLAADPRPGDVLFVDHDFTTATEAGIDYALMFKVVSVSGEHVVLREGTQHLPLVFALWKARSLAAVPGAFATDPIPAAIDVNTETGTGSLAQQTEVTLDGGDGIAIGSVEGVVRTEQP